MVAKVKPQALLSIPKPEDGTWSQMPVCAALDRRLGQVTPLHVLAALTNYRNTVTGRCDPSTERIAADLGVHVRSVQRHISELVRCGYVVVISRRRTSNQYIIQYPARPTRNGSAQPEATHHVA